SEEELACLRVATAIAEAGVEELIAVAAPGVEEVELYGRVMGRLLALGSEYYPLALTTRPVDAEGEGRRYTSPPLGRRLETGTLVGNEVSAVWGGQIAQEDQPVVVGPVPDAWHAAMALQREVFEAGLERMRPGTPFGELIDFIATFERD